MKQTHFSYTFYNTPKSRERDACDHYEGVQLVKDKAVLAASWSKHSRVAPNDAIKSKGLTRKVFQAETKHVALIRKTQMWKSHILHNLSE